jgi:dTDP-4-amino-4,6-dideoxygalactose transaminase
MSEIQVPLLDLQAQYAQIREPVDAAIQRVVASQRFVLGPEVEGLEAEIAEYCESPHAVGCSSGSDALLLALTALGVEAGDEVICPTYTFFSTAGTIARIGAKPVLADIEAQSFNVTAETLRAAARNTTRLRAIIVVHLYGRSAEMDEILALADELGVPVIEDGAQALGARDSAGRRVGTSGAIGCFSFFPSKNLGGYGDGGIVVSDDPGLADQMRSLRVHGETTQYVHSMIGFNSRLDAIQAAVLRVKLRYLDDWIAARGRNAALYSEAFCKSGAATGAGEFSGLALPLRVPEEGEAHARHTFNQYVVRVPGDRRDALREHLAAGGVASAIYYPIPLHLQACFIGLGQTEGSLPQAELAAHETIALPIYPELDRAQIEHVVQTVRDFFDT